MSTNAQAIENLKSGHYLKWDTKYPYTICKVTAVSGSQNPTHFRVEYVQKFKLGHPKVVFSREWNYKDEMIQTVNQELRDELLGNVLYLTPPI